MSNNWNNLAVSEGISFGGGRAVVQRHSFEPDRFKLILSMTGEDTREIQLSRAELGLLVHVCNDALELTK